MDKYRIAKTISTLTNPPIICIPLFLIICLTLSLKHKQDFLTLEIVSLVFASILPMAIIMIWAKIIGTDNDISNRSDRYIPLIVGIISYFIGFLISLSMHLDNFLTCLVENCLIHFACVIERGHFFRERFSQCLGDCDLADHCRRFALPI